MERYCRKVRGGERKKDRLKVDAGLVGENNEDAGQIETKAKVVVL
jgi:hypothetical protein